MSLFKKRRAVATTAPATPDSVTLRVTAVEEWHPGDWWSDMYHPGDIDSGRYNIGISRSESHELSVCDPALHVRAVITGGKRPVRFYGRSASRSPSERVKGYRIEGAHDKSVQGLPLLDEATMLQLVADSKKTDPEMWRNAMTESRRTRLDWLWWHGAIGSGAWSGVFIVATFITLSVVGVFAS